MNNQYQQPNPAPNPNQYIPPQKPYVDPAAAKKQKTEAINELSGKVSEILKTCPILSAIEKNSEIFSYIVTAACFLLTVVLMTMGILRISFGIIAVIFGFFALSKKKVLPLTVAMTVLSLFTLVCFIGSIANIIDIARYGFYISKLGAAILSMIFYLAELGAMGFLTYLSWTYHLATVPPKPVQQNYYNQQQSTQQYNNPAVSQPAAPQPAQPAAPAKPDPILQPITPPPSPTPTQTPTPIQSSAADSAPVSHKFCTACGTENNADSIFCKNCGKKF